MAVSGHFDHFGHTGTQDMAESLYTEAIKHRGVDVQYIQRDRLNDDTILGESDKNRFKNFITIEMALTSINEFNGDGDMFAKFGFDLSDSASWEVSRSRFKEEADANPLITIDEPQEGDLIYLPISNSLWEITKAKGDERYYFHGTKYGFRLSSQLFEYSHEDFDTGIDEIDEINDMSTAVGGLIAEIEEAEGIKADVTQEIVEDDLIQDDFFDPDGDIL